MSDAETVESFLRTLTEVAEDDSDAEAKAHEALDAHLRLAQRLADAEQALRLARKRNADGIEERARLDAAYQASIAAAEARARAWQDQAEFNVEAWGKEKAARLRAEKVLRWIDQHHEGHNPMTSTRDGCLGCDAHAYFAEEPQDVEAGDPLAVEPGEPQGSRHPGGESPDVPRPDPASTPDLLEGGRQP